MQREYIRLGEYLIERSEQHIFFLGGGWYANKTRMPNPRAIAAVPRPIAPSPIMPMVAPRQFAYIMRKQTELFRFLPRPLLDLLPVRQQVAA